MKKAEKFIEVIAKENGYEDKFQLLRDYRFVPTVLTPKHRKIEMVGLVLKHMKKHKSM